MGGLLFLYRRIKGYYSTNSKTYLNMKKVLLASAIVCFSLVACNNGETKTEKKEGDTTTVVKKDTSMVVTKDTSMVVTKDTMKVVKDTTIKTTTIPAGKEAKKDEKKK
jgi:uncharacterized membrane protein